MPRERERQKEKKNYELLHIITMGAIKIVCRAKIGSESTKKVEWKIEAINCAIDDKLNFFLRTQKLFSKKKKIEKIFQT